MSKWLANDTVAFEHPKHVRFSCERCAICCGDTKNRNRTVLLMKTEAERISSMTLRTIDYFAERVENWEPYNYVMKKNEDGKCFFLRSSECSIYRTRPLVCRFYPFELKNMGGNRYVFSYTDECPCIGKGSELGDEYFERLFAESERLIRENMRKKR